MCLSPPKPSPPPKPPEIPKAPEIEEAAGLRKARDRRAQTLRVARQSVSGIGSASNTV